MLIIYLNKKLTEMSNQEMNLFKDEVLKRIRELEKKFFKELSKKHFDININFEYFTDKVNSILESNQLMIESITNQKLHFEKINNLETNKKEIEGKLITHEIRINNTLNEIKKMKFNYDKIITENLIIPAYIGPGSMYKSLGEFIISSIEEFKKFKEDKEKIRNTNEELKTRIDLMTKNLTNFVEFNSSRCIAYTDSKEKEYQLKLDDKFKKLDEKSLENNQHIYSNQIKMEEKLKEMGEKIGEISKIKSKPDKPETNFLIFDKLEEIKKKEEEMNEKLQKAIKEVKELKLMKKELTEQMKNINLKIEDLNKNSKLQFSQQSKINQDLFNINKKNNINSLGNILYNTNNNINNLNEQKNKSKSKKSELPNLSNLINPFETRKIETKNKIYRNENKRSIINYDSKTEEEKKESLFQIKKLNKNTNDNTFRKSTTNLFTEVNIKEKEKEKGKETDLKMVTPRIENAFLSPKGTNNNKIRIKKKIYEKSTNDLRYNLKDSKRDIIFEKEKDTKDEHSDKQKLINLNTEIRKRIRRENNEIEKYGKTSMEFYKKYQEKPEMIIKPLLKKHKKKQSILVQTNKIINNNILKKEFINDIKNDENDNYINNKIIHETENNINAIECNIVNLNLLDLPDNKSKIMSLNEFTEKSFDSKNQNKKQIKSIDSKKQIKVAPIFGRTTYTFYDYKDTGKKNNNGNLYNANE